tara:strand:+ start:46 stop:669 length:624 start_codon:yes stop_codon:yes gene_type:complete
MIKRIAIFDFCGTLIKTQTGFEFFRFIYLKEVSIRFKLFYNLYRLLSKISNDYDLQFFILAKGVKGLSKEKIRNLSAGFFKEYLLRNQNSRLIKCLKEHQRKGDIVIIASGGFEEYIKEYASYYGVDGFVATRLQYANGKSNGKIFGQRCLGREKLRRLEDKVNFELFDTFMYTDDPEADFFVLERVNKGYVFNHDEALLPYKINYG